MCRFDAPWPPAIKTIIVRTNNQQKHQTSSLEQKYYKYILSSALATLFQESRNTDLTETDLLCKGQVPSEEY